MASSEGREQGTAEELAQRLGVSRSTVFDIINCMKAMGADVEYNKAKRSYYYTSDKDLAIGFLPSNQIKGGKNFVFSLEYDFFRLQASTFVS